jgi:hypothetical protein
LQLQEPLHRAYSSANVGTYTVAVTYTLDGASAGNYSLVAGTGTGAITKAPLGIGAPSIASKAYNGSNAAGALTIGGLSGVVSPDSVSVSGLTPSYGAANVGTYLVPVTYTLSGSAAGNYTLPDGTASGQITKVQLTIAVLPALASRPYDGSTTPGALSIGAASGVVGTEDVTVVGTADPYSSPNAGTYSDQVTYGLSGTAQGNYLAPVAPPVINGVVTAVQLTISAPTISSKVYDATSASAAIDLGTINGVLSGDSVTLTPTTSYGPDAGTYSVTVSYDMTGGAGNYLAPAATDGVSAVITKKALTISGTKIASRKADRTKFAGEVTPGTIQGLLGTDSVDVTGSAEDYSSAAAGTYETTVSYLLTNGEIGNAENYSLADSTGVSGVVTPVVTKVQYGFGFKFGVSKPSGKEITLWTTKLNALNIKHGDTVIVTGFSGTGELKIIRTLRAAALDKLIKSFFTGTVGTVGSSRASDNNTLIANGNRGVVITVIHN